LKRKKFGERKSAGRLVEFCAQIVVMFGRSKAIHLVTYFGVLDVGVGEWNAQMFGRRCNA